jgi:hypothetical protein
VIGVEVGDVHGAHERPGRHEAVVDGEPGPPQLTVDPLAAVDEVGGVADDDGVGVPTSRRLGERAAAGAEQHDATRRVGLPRRTALDHRCHGAVKLSGHQAP